LNSNPPVFDTDFEGLILEGDFFGLDFEEIVGVTFAVVLVLFSRRKWS